MSTTIKKRIALGAGALATAGAAAALAAGATLGLFSATSPAQTDQFTAGTVTLSQPTNVSCTITNVVPGDANSGQCTFSITYSGTAPALLGVDLAVAGTAAASVPAGYGYAAPTPLPMYDGSAAGIGLTVGDGSATYMSGQTFNGGTLTNNSGVNGLLVSGTEANRATKAALAAYPGAIVDRVVKLSNGEYEVHYIGVNWPHHIFVHQDFKVVGAG